MNWRRGLFRLWIVGSALFVIAVAFVSYGDIKKEFDRAAVLSHLTPITDPKLIAELEATPPEPVTDPKLIPKLEALDKVLSDRRAGRAPNPWAAVGIGAAMAFGIPLVVLVLGSSLVWAFSGFAAKRT
jgi:hypothetical protein